MKRWFAVCISLLFAAGCSGMGGGGNRFLPQSSAPNAAPPAASADASVRPDGVLGVTPEGRDRLAVAVTMRIPRRHRGERIPVHPATISPLTQSVSIAVNKDKARVFNATISSPNCTTGTSGRTCTFKVGAPAGNDSFVVTTYSGVNGGGTALNRGSAMVNIQKGKNNSPHIVLGPLVSNVADSGVGSLRYAIGASTPGDTIIFGFASGKINLLSPITLNSNVKIAGPGVKAANNTYSGVTVSGKGAQQVFIINTGVNASISGLIVTDGKAAVANKAGGAISNQGTLTLAGDAITDSTSIVTNLHVRPHGRHHAKRPHAPQPKIRTAGNHVPHKRHGHSLRPHVCGTDQYGGAVYNNGTLTITGTTFDGNVVASSSACATTGYGGAIYNDQNGSIFSSTSKYINNGAEYGGAVYNDGTYGQVSFTGDTFNGNFGCNNKNGCVTSGCATATSCTSYAEGYGGAIYDADGPGVVVSKSNFTSNIVGGNLGTAYGEGGAIYLDAESALITNTTFNGNVAGGSFTNCGQGYGGAIYEDEGGPVELDNDVFTNNVASGDEDGYGGAIYNDAQSDNGSNNTFSGNQALAPGSDCEDTPYSYGGALYAYYGANISKSVFKNNVASSAYEAEGGAIYSDDPTNLSNDTFTANSAVCTSATDEDCYVYGGVIEADDGAKVSNSTFTSNSAKAMGAYGYYLEGGVIYGGSTLQLSGNTFTSNSALATYIDSADLYGGVIYANSTLFSSKDVFKSNVTTSLYDIDGGVIYEDSDANVSSDTFTSNTSSAPYAYGAAIENDGSSSNVVSNSIFTSNVAGSGFQFGYGGATYDDYATAYNGDTFTGNKAVFAGGATYDDGGGTVNNSTYTGNSVSNAGSYYGGGAIYDAGGTTINNSTFTSNTVTPAGIQGGGGAVYNDDGMDVYDSTFSGNKTFGSVANTGGGAIFNYDDLYVENSTIVGNSSTTDGGAYNDYYAYTVEFYNSTLYGNTATRRGGNIENPYTLYLYGSIVAGGSAGIGGPDIDNSGSATLTSGDYNIIGKGVTGSGTFTPSAHDVIGTAGAPKNPGLSPLSTNGGPTQTMADSASSLGYQKIPVMSGSCNNTGITVDQRGFNRGSSKCDIGAFQINATPSTMRAHSHHRHAIGHHHKHAKHHHLAPIEHKHPRHTALHGVTK